MYSLMSAFTVILECSKDLCGYHSDVYKSNTRVWLPFSKKIQKSALNKEGRQSLNFTMCYWDIWHSVQAPQSYRAALGLGPLACPIQRPN